MKNYLKHLSGIIFGHYSGVIMYTVASQITSLTIVYSTVCPCVDQRKRQSAASLAFARGIHRSPVYSPHKGTVTRKMFSFDEIIMSICRYSDNQFGLSGVYGTCTPKCLHTFDHDTHDCRLQHIWNAINRVKLFTVCLWNCASAFFVFF